MKDNKIKRFNKKLKVVINDSRYLQDVSKGGKTPPPVPKVDPEDKMTIVKGDMWEGPPTPFWLKCLVVGGFIGINVIIWTAVVIL